MTWERESGTTRTAVPEGLSERVQVLLAEPGYASLLAAVRKRVEATGQAETVTVRGLDFAARRALADLLGLPRRPGASAPIRLADLDAALRGSRVAAGLAEVLEATGGPLEDRRASRAAQRRAREALWEDLSGHPAVARPAVAAWLADLRSSGHLTRVSADVEDARDLASAALAVVERLPAARTPLAVIAAEATGDPHALDPGEPLNALVLGAVVRLVGGDGVPGGAVERRRLWADVGVLCDPLSASVLVLGLQLDSGCDLIATVLGDHALFSEPVRLTLRQLENAETLRPSHDRVLVCENPSVVAAAADRLDFERCPVPLVCVEGMPNVAADTLLRGLAGHGCRLEFHGDFDWGGLRIGNVLASRYGAVPWRFGAGDYREGCDHAAVTSPLRGAPVTAAWDADLTTAMRHVGRTVAEEQVLDVLLADLGA